MRKKRDEFRVLRIERFKTRFWKKEKKTLFTQRRRNGIKRKTNRWALLRESRTNRIKSLRPIGTSGLVKTLNSNAEKKNRSYKRYSLCFKRSAMWKCAWNHISPKKMFTSWFLRYPNLTKKSPIRFNYLCRRTLLQRTSIQSKYRSRRVSDKLKISAIEFDKILYYRNKKKKETIDLHVNSNCPLKLLFFNILVFTIYTSKNYFIKTVFECDFCTNNKIIICC